MRAATLSPSAERIAARMVPRYVRFERGMLTRADALQIARVAAWEACESYDPQRGASLETWIACKVRGALLDMMRSRTYDAFESRAGVPFISTVSLDGLTFGYTPDLAGGLEREEQGERLLRTIRCLPPRERQVIVWRYYDELTFPAIAARLSVSEARAHQLHGQGIKRLREYAARDGLCAA